MTHQHHHDGPGRSRHAGRHDAPGDEAAEWDEFYAGDGDDAAHWSGRPNGTLATEVTGLAPGTALDIGCGEGLDPAEHILPADVAARLER
jgi:hypothetical protein